MKIFEFMIQHEYWFALLAVIASAYLGFVGMAYSLYNEKDPSQLLPVGGKISSLLPWQELLRGSRFFLSEVVASMAGWGCLYAIAWRHHIPGLALGFPDLFLLLGTVIGISGNSYRIFEIFEKNKR